MSDDKKTLDVELKERFAQLPKVVQNAITSAEVEKLLRSLADTQKLHLDQWQSLENEVMMALLGVQPIGNLQENIGKEVGVSADVAKTLAENINKIVFEPIRQELERQLEHPEAQAKQVSTIEAARAETLAGAQPAAGSQQPGANSESAPSSGLQAPSSVLPATPPSLVPDIKVTRPSESTAYKPGEPSTQRAAVHDDPYREPPL